MFKYYSQLVCIQSQFVGISQILMHPGMNSSFPQGGVGQLNQYQHTMVPPQQAPSKIIYVDLNGNQKVFRQSNSVDKSGKVVSKGYEWDISDERNICCDKVKCLVDVENYDGKGDYRPVPGTSFQKPSAA